MNETKQTVDKLYSQQRNATFITLITFILMLLLTVVTLFFVAPEDKTIIDDFMIPGLALGAVDQSGESGLLQWRQVPGMEGQPDHGHHDPVRAARDFRRTGKSHRPGAYADRAEAALS